MTKLKTSEYVQQLIKTLQPDPREASYYEALGRFIASYAITEALIHKLARHYSGTDDTKARVIFAGFRLTDSIDRLRALSKLPVKSLGLLSTYVDQGNLKNIEECLAQLALITDKRSKLVHRSITYSDAGFTVSDLSTARSIINHKPDFVTLKDMKSMDADCTLIYLRLAALMNPEFYDHPSWSRYLDQPWQYKPLPPPPQKAKPLGGRRERKRQRRASQRSPQKG